MHIASASRWLLSMKRFYIDQDDIRSLGLRGSVLLCYTALRALCANPSASWRGSYQRLSDESGCGCRMTAERSVSALVKRGLIRKDGNQFSIAQFVQISAQIVQPNAQSVQFSKEKSNKKENIIKEIKGGGGNIAPPPPPTYFDVFSFGKQKNIPESVCLGFYAYYSEFNWKHKNGDYVTNWKATLTNWYLREKKSAAKSVYQSIYGHASEQQQAEYAGSQYAEYQARKQKEQQEEQARQQNEETRYISYADYKKQKK